MLGRFASDSNLIVVDDHELSGDVRKAAAIAISVGRWRRSQTTPGVPPVG